MKNRAKFYIGIDSSKDQLDYAILKGKTRDAPGRIKQHNRKHYILYPLTHGIPLKDCIFGLEHTGMYGNL